jgi:hypothetical protein
MSSRADLSDESAALVTQRDGFDPVVGSIPPSTSGEVTRFSTSSGRIVTGRGCAFLAGLVTAPR